MNESKSIAVVAPETDQTVEQSSIGSSSVSDKNEEVETLTGLASELEKKASANLSIVPYLGDLLVPHLEIRAATWGGLSPTQPLNMWSLV